MECASAAVACAARTCAGTMNSTASCSEARHAMVMVRCQTFAAGAGMHHSHCQRLDTLSMSQKI